MKPSNHGIGSHFADADVNQLDLEYFGVVQRYIASYNEYLRAGQGMLLSGNPGIGKTYASVALLFAINKIRGSLFDFQMVSAPELFDRAYPIRDAVDDPFRGQTFDRTYETVKGLLINDLGKEDRISGWRQERVLYILGRLLRARHERNLPVFITTNLPLTVEDNSVEKTYGPSIWSLIHDMTIFRVEITGPDLRKQMAKDRLTNAR